MREVISVHVGQAGVQLGSACWELFCLEHNICSDGTQKIIDPNDQNFKIIFNEFRQERFSPRAVFIDLEPSAINEIRTGSYRDIYTQNQFIAGKDDSSSNFARGFYTVGREALSDCLDQIQKQADSCEDLEGFLLYHSVGGGTGSGLGSLLLEKLSELYPKKAKLNFSIYPEPHLSTEFTSPYNSLLSTHYSLEHSTSTIALDNSAIFDICRYNLGIERPTHNNLNSIIAHLISNVTGAIRYDGSLNTSLEHFQTYMIPYPRAHFLLSAYASITHNLETVPDCSVLEVSSMLISSRYAMVKCNQENGKYMSMCLGYRGDIVPKDLCQAICMIKSKRTVQFVDWCPTGIRCGINYHPMCVVNDSVIKKSRRSGYMVANSTAIGELFVRVRKEVDMMYKHRAYLHWYVGEGMQEQEIEEARENIVALEADYLEMTAETTEEEVIN